MENYEAAEQYCAEIGRPDAYMQSVIFLPLAVIQVFVHYFIDTSFSVCEIIRLLDIYLDPKDGREPMFKAAVRLLHNHGEMLDPLQVLEV